MSVLVQRVLLRLPLRAVAGLRHPGAATRSVPPQNAAGPAGTAVQVQWVEGEERDEKLEVSVRFPGGEVVRLDGPGGATRTIDVEWHDVN